MEKENIKQSFISRYTVNSRLGNFPLWQGFEVTDSLSGRNYLLFALQPDKPVALAVSDMKMRDFLFSSSSELIPSALSLQENAGGIFFLLSYTSTALLEKALPAMKDERCLSILKTLTCQVLDIISSGLFFHNLSAESIILIDDSPVILPVSFLIPGKILDHRSFSTNKPPGFEPLFRDLDALGKIFSTFSKHLPSGESGACRTISRQLCSLTRKTAPEDYYTALEQLVSFAGIDDTRIPPFSLKTRFSTPSYVPAIRKLRQAAFNAREGNKQFVLVRGGDGEGKTSFLEDAVYNLIDEWGFAGGEILSDQDTCRDTIARGEKEGPSYIVIDTRMQEPMLYSYIINKLSRELDRHSIAIISIGKDTTPVFIESLVDEGRLNDFRISTIELPSIEDDEKKRITSVLLPEPLKKQFLEETPPGKTLSYYGILSRMLSVSTPERFKKNTGKSLLGTLTPEERSVIDFIAAFRFEVPLSVLQDIYSTEENGFYTIIQRLVSLGLLRMTAEESLLCNNRLSLSFSITTGSLSRSIQASIPSSRKKDLHRNIAHILKDNRDAPLAYIFYHLVSCGEKADAAFKGMEIFHLLLGRKTINAINCFNEYFMGRKLARYLPPEMHFKLYLELGDYFSLIGNYDKAEQLFRKCREETGRNEEWHKLRSLAAEAIRKECEILEKRGEFKKTESLLKKALDTHGEHILASERAKLYNDLAWVHYRLGQLNESWENCLIVHKIIDKKQHPRELSQSLSLMGAINWNRSKYDDAVMCHKKCLAIREECNDERGVGASYNNLGLVYRSMGRIKDALDNFTRSMKIKQRNNNLPGLAVAHLNLALAYMDLEEIEKAEKNCQISRQLAETLGNQQLLAEIFGTAGEICYIRGDLEGARDHYFSDLHICHKTKSMREKAIVFRRLGDISLTEGKLTEATELLNQARGLNRKIGSRLETILLDLLEGRILIAEGKRERGRMKLEGTSFELSLLGRKNTAASVTAEIGELFLDEGNEYLAREYLLRSLSLIGESGKMPRQVQHLQDHLEQRRTTETGRLHTDSARFRTLCRIISFIRTIKDPEKLYSTITETAKTATGMERAALILQNDDQNTFRFLAQIGEFGPDTTLTDKNIIAILNISRQLGYPLDVSRSKIPEGKVSNEFLKEHPGIICTPLWIQDEMTGFLYLDSTRKSTKTTDEDHSFLVAFTQQTALGMEGILLGSRLRELEKSMPSPPTIIPALKKKVTFRDIIGKSPAMRQVYDLVESIKDMDTAILLTGPNGSGKDLIAKAIHNIGPRNSQSFHHVNCGSFPRDLLESILFGHEKGSFTSAHKLNIGHFEKARGGTIYLDEIAEIPLPLQSKLLRVLEEQKFFRVGGNVEIETDVRIITATNRDLKKMVREGTFREDLYYRINVFPIRIPSLSERREDIVLLCNHFLTTFCRLYNIPTKHISPEAMTYLSEYDWPGNVRELENMIKRMIIISRKDTILPEDLPEGIIEHTETVQSQALNTLEDVIESLLDNIEFSFNDPILAKVEGSIIRKVVEKTGDKQKAAKLLGISKPTLYARLKKYE